MQILASKTHPAIRQKEATRAGTSESESKAERGQEADNCFL